jgi:hypothetical protein
MTPQALESLIALIFDAQHPSPELAARANLSLSELSRWAAEPSNARLLEGLVRLEDVRAQIVLSRYRAGAAVRLIEIGTQGQPSELARKACVDLLKLNMPEAFARARDPDAPPPAPDPEAILAAFERIGNMDL